MKKYVIFPLLVILLSPTAHAEWKKCADFKTQKEAEAWYEKRKKSGQTG